MSVPSLPADTELTRYLDKRLADALDTALNAPRPGLWCGLCGAQCDTTAQLVDHDCYGPPAPLHGILTSPLEDVVLSDRSGLRLELRAAGAIGARTVRFSARGVVS